MMKGNHNTQSCEYAILCQDGLHIVSTTHEEILHMLKDNTRSILIFRIKIHMTLVEEIFVNVISRNILKVICQC